MRKRREGRGGNEEEEGMRKRREGGWEEPIWIYNTRED